MRIRVPKPSRTFLEMDELVALVDAAAGQDAPLPTARITAASGPGTRGRVAALAAAGRRASEIAAELGLAKATVSYHLKHLNLAAPGEYVGRRAVIEILGRSGVRASELCDLRLRDLRLHDPDGARFRIPDAKTEAGIREVQMSPDLVEAFVEHLDRLRRAGRPVDPDAYAVPNLNGERMSRQRVGQIVGDGAHEATRRHTARGLPPLPNVTPHTLRRTYISIALLANNFDVKWVMSQVGHADSKMTLDVYAQLEQRVQRAHGTGFDRLMRRAREQLYGALPEGLGGGVLPPNCPSTADPGAQTLAEPARADAKKRAGSREEDDMARPGLEPGTPRFSVVCSTS